MAHSEIVRSNYHISLPIGAGGNLCNLEISIRDARMKTLLGAHIVSRGVLLSLGYKLNQFSRTLSLLKTV